MINNSKYIHGFTSKITLLYVEDDDQARETTTLMLSNFFDNIIVAVNGRDGIEKFNENNIDLIITDINMPILNGLDMIKELDADIPIMIISAHNEPEFLLEAIRFGVDGFIIKPLEHTQFLKSLGSIVEKMILLDKSKNYQEMLESEVKERTKELQNKLEYDELTSLYSRYSFFKDIELVESPTALIIDIDEFKIINEIYTTKIGSKVLEELAQFLSEYIKDKEYKAYRLSGDEFVLLSTRTDGTSISYEKDIHELMATLKSFKVELEDDTINIDVTIGVSIGQSDVFECAKIALDYARMHSKSFAIYSQSIDKRQEDSNAIACKKKILSALQEKRVVAVYQPIVDSSKKIVKHESLMRILNEDGTLITPYHFLNIAKKTKLYKDLSRIVLLGTLELLSEDIADLSMNFTYEDIKNASLLDDIESVLVSKGKLASKAIFEITESESMENFDDMKEFIKRFRALGVKIAIDDFGSGFSNFEYILEIEPDYLKIDGSLIKNIDNDSKALTLVNAIIEFSHQLNIKVIAEFVHSEVIYEMLKEIEVDEYQGFYFSEPLQKIGV